MKKRSTYTGCLLLTVFLLLAAVVPLPAGADSTGRLAKGKFLIASREMADPRFEEAVILLIKYDREEGAMGLIINLPSKTPLSKLLPDIKELRDDKEKVFIGGPVELDRVFIAARSAVPPEASFHVLGNTYIISDMGTFRKMLSRHRKGDRFRIFAGYAGWGAGQLEGEVAAGQWRVMAAEGKYIFDVEPSLLWQRLIILFSGIQVGI
jgi:putative transcriptional regulator